MQANSCMTLTANTQDLDLAYTNTDDLSQQFLTGVGKISPGKFQHVRGNFIPVENSSATP